MKFAEYIESTYVHQVARIKSEGEKFPGFYSNMQSFIL